MEENGRLQYSKKKQMLVAEAAARDFKDFNGFRDSKTGKWEIWTP